VPEIYETEEETLHDQNLPNVWQLKWQHQSNAPHLVTDQVQEALISILEYILENKGWVLLH
jgi:hypothetical protein